MNICRAREELLSKGCRFSLEVPTGMDHRPGRSCRHLAHEPTGAQYQVVSRSSDAAVAHTWKRTLCEALKLPQPALQTSPDRRSDHTRRAWNQPIFASTSLRSDSMLAARTFAASSFASSALARSFPAATSFSKRACAASTRSSLPHRLLSCGAVAGCLSDEGPADGAAAKSGRARVGRSSCSAAGRGGT